MDQLTGETVWSIKLGNQDSNSIITEISFSGVLGSDEYQRLYAVGNNPDGSGTRNYIAVVNTYHDKNDKPEEVTKAFELTSSSASGYDSNFLLQHVYIQYLYLFVCAEHQDARDSSAGTDGQPWFEWGVMDDETDEITMQKRWAWTEENSGSEQQWCAGLYSDGTSLFTLVGTN